MEGSNSNRSTCSSSSFHSQTPITRPSWMIVASGSLISLPFHRENGLSACSAETKRLTISRCPLRYVSRYGMKLIADSCASKRKNSASSDSAIRNSSFVPSTGMGTSFGLTSAAARIASVTLIPAHQAKSFTRAGDSALKYCVASWAHASSIRRLNGSISGRRLDVSTSEYDVESSRFLDWSLMSFPSSLRRLIARERLLVRPIRLRSWPKSWISEEGTTS